MSNALHAMHHRCVILATKMLADVGVRGFEDLTAEIKSDLAWIGDGPVAFVRAKL